MSKDIEDIEFTEVKKPGRPRLTEEEKKERYLARLRREAALRKEIKLEKQKAEDRTKLRNGRSISDELYTVSDQDVLNVVSGSTTRTPHIVNDSQYVKDLRNTMLQTTESLMEQAKRILANELQHLELASDKGRLTSTDARNLNKYTHILTVITREERENLKYSKAVEDTDLLKMISATFKVDQRKLEQLLIGEDNE